MRKKKKVDPLAGIPYAKDGLHLKMTKSAEFEMNSKMKKQDTMYG